MMADDPLLLRIKVRANASVGQFRISLTIFKLDGTPVGNAFGPELPGLSCKHEAVYDLELHGTRLAPGPYYLNVATGQGDHLNGRTDFDLVTEVVHFEVRPPVGDGGVCAEWCAGWGAIRFDSPGVTRVD